MSAAGCNQALFHMFHGVVIGRLVQMHHRRSQRCLKSGERCWRGLIDPLGMVQICVHPPTKPWFLEGVLRFGG